MGNCLSCCGCQRKERDSVYEPLLDDREREAVADLLQFLENRSDALLLEGDSLKALSTLSYSNNVDLQRSAALAFAEITERNVEEVDTVVLEPLLYLLRESSDVEVQRAASAALGNLAVNIPNKLKIVRLGGLDSLIKQMNSPNVEVQCNAVGCITNLATHEENKNAVARSGALVPLTRLARQTKDIRVQRNATGALLNMTHSEDNRRELVDAGAIPVLVSLLRSNDMDVVYYCCTALSNLAVDVVNRKKLSHEARLINELVELTESSSVKIQCQATLALRNLASDEVYQLEIARHPRALGRLLYLMSNHGGSSTTNNERSPHRNLVLASVACVRNISIHPQNETVIIESGFLKPLVVLLSDETEEIQCHAVSTLRNLAASGGLDTNTSNETDASNKEKIIESGAIEKIKLLIESSYSNKSTGSSSSSSGKKIGWNVLSEITACLAVLALGDKIKMTLLRMGFIKTLLPLIRQEIPAEVQGNAAAALGNLATKCPSANEFIEQWQEMTEYLIRFLSLNHQQQQQQQHRQLQNEPSIEQDDTISTFQHISVWTILQLSESDDLLREKLAKDMRIVKCLQELPMTNKDEEVLQLVNRVSMILSLKQ